jgi:4'-phosphopantetheinyl transferase
VRHQADVPPGDNWLSGRERSALARLRQPKRREDWRLGRWTAKTALALPEDLDETPDVLSGIEIWTEPTGAPVLIRWDERIPYVMSLSHSNQVALCCLAEEGALLGCDVEWVAPKSDPFLYEFFTPEERMQVASGAGFDRDAILSVLWCAKESALKALGCGLHIDPFRLRVSLGDLSAEEEWGRLSVSMGPSRSFTGWWRIGQGFAWAVVAFPECAPPRPL